MLCLKLLCPGAEIQTLNRLTVDMAGYRLEAQRDSLFLTEPTPPFAGDVRNVQIFLDAATLTEGFPCFLLGCKANARV